MHYLIYKITNRLNNKFYVGKHKTENKDDGYLGSGVLIERAIAKHGKENFIKEILFELATEDEMNQKEADIVDEDFVSRDDTYNLKLGGQGGFDFINSTGKNLYEGHSDVARQNARLGLIQYERLLKSDPEFREAHRCKIVLALERYRKIHGNGFQGKTHTIESRRRISSKMKGRNVGKKNPAFGQFWITNGEINKRIPKTSLIPEGFRKGRV